jgi:hypothetical protein
MKKVTDNMVVVYGALKEMGGKGFAREVLNFLTEKGVAGKTFNGVNATLAALAGKGIVTKAKGVLGEKMLTEYTIVAELVAEAEAVAE